MSTFRIDILEWLAAAGGDPVERSTMCSLRVAVGSNAIPVTEVYDAIAQTTREHVNVPAYLLGRWLIVNWWRLRWEAKPSQPTTGWIEAHGVCSIGGGYAWPSCEIFSDGESIQVRAQAESTPDVSAIRYLRSAAPSIPAVDFESGCDAFLDTVAARLSLVLPADSQLQDLLRELQAERADPVLARLCRLQARAGIDPGDASDDWLKEAQELVALAGAAAGEEVLAAVPSLPQGIRDAELAIGAMKESNATVKLDWVELEHSPSDSADVPWRRGRRLAQNLRMRLGLGSGPISNRRLAELLGAHLPLPKSLWNGPIGLRGGFRDPSLHGRTAVLVTSERMDRQRFDLTRLIGAALLSDAQQHVLAVSDMSTALQKFERSFAREFLCPWADLKAFVGRSGTDEEGLEEAAEYFGVSTWVVENALRDNGWIERSE